MKDAACVNASVMRASFKMSVRSRVVQFSAIIQLQNCPFLADRALEQ